MQNIISQLGIFGFFAVTITISFLALSFFIKFLRGILLILCLVSCFYYYGIATPEIKKEMDKRTQEIYQTITKKFKN
jgi:hypothetical protein